MATARDPKPRIDFTAEVVRVERTLLLQLPPAASDRLPSRGQVAVQGAVDGHTFAAVMEPDGRGGHWLRLDAALRRTTGLEVGDTAAVNIEVAREWPEPAIPEDLAHALESAPAEVRSAWQDITPMARWEWVRWVQATKSDDTRERRVGVSISKLKDGKRRPCCFDLASCTDQDVATSGKLRETSSL
jgi:hypothetical protein